MNKKTAVLLFLGICIVLAILLLTQTIDHIISGIVFALALIIPGGLSKGFRKV